MIAQAEPRTVKTVAELAAVLGRDERTVFRYFTRGMGDAAKTKAGSYSVAKAKQWIANNIQTDKSPYSKSEVPDAELAVELKRAELRKETAQAEAIELKNAVLRGELVPRDDVSLQFAEVGAMVRQRLESIPDEMQMLFPPDSRDELTREVGRKIENILREMSTWRVGE